MLPWWINWWGGWRWWIKWATDSQSFQYCSQWGRSRSIPSRHAKGKCLCYADAVGSPPWTFTFHWLIVQTVQDSCRLSPTQFTSLDASFVASASSVWIVHKRKKEEASFYSVFSRTLRVVRPRVGWCTTSRQILTVVSSWCNLVILLSYERAVANSKNSKTILRSAVAALCSHEQ